MEDVVVTKDEAGKVKLHQTMNLTVLGAAGGGFWGMLIGMIFLNPLLGAAVGAGAGALSGAVSDLGVDDKFMKELADSFKPVSLFSSCSRKRPLTRCWMDWKPARARARC